MLLGLFLTMALKQIDAHALVGVDEPVGLAVEVRSIDLVKVTDEDDL